MISGKHFTHLYALQSQAQRLLYVRRHFDVPVPLGGIHVSLHVYADSLVDVRGVGGVATGRGRVVFLLDSNQNFVLIGSLV